VGLLKKTEGAEDLGREVWVILKSILRMAKDRVNRIRLPPERDQWPATVKIARSVRIPQTAGNALIKLMVINILRTTVLSLESRLLLNVSRRCSLVNLHYTAAVVMH
jgi:hypothetical protein